MSTEEPTELTEEQKACDHGLTFDEKAAHELLDAKPPAEGPLGFIMGSPAVAEIRKRWPRGSGKCEKCGLEGIKYASYAHYLCGDW